MIEVRSVIAFKTSPVADCTIPILSLRCHGALLQVLNRCIVDRDHTRSCTGFDRHIAKRHPTFHAQRSNRRASKFNRITSTARRTDSTDDGKHHIFSGHPTLKIALHLHKHVLHLFGDQTLGRHHMLNLRSSNTKGEAGKRAVGAGVRVATHHGHPRQCRALLWSDHMHNALTLIKKREIHWHLECSNVLIKCDHLFT